MRAVIQRVTRAQVESEGLRVADMGPGLMVLVGVGRADTERDAQELARKLVGLRVFDDEDGRMDRSLVDVEGTLGLVSQFTLWGDLRKGRRPSFGAAAPPELAEPLFDLLVEEASGLGVSVVTGRFRTAMQVSLVNDGPVTLLIDTERTF
jgi:D-tyrosyl-tRNA(Tyr) deacylase